MCALLLVMWKIKPPAPLASSESDKKPSQLGKLRRIDFLGAISLASAIVSFLLIVDLGGGKLSWKSSLIWAIFAIAAFCGIVFILNEAYVAREPIFPLRLLVHRDVMSAYLLQALQSGAQYAVWPLLNESNPRIDQFTHQTLGHVHCPAIFPSHSPHISSQCRCSPVPRCLWQCGWWSTQRVYHPTVYSFNPLLSIHSLTSCRTASYKYLTITGTIIATLGYLLLILFWHGNTSIWESLYITPGGFGMGVVYATTFVGLTAGVEERQMAIAGTGLYLSSNLGMLTGVSVASKIMQASLRKELQGALIGFDGREMVSAISDKVGE